MTDAEYSPYDVCCFHDNVMSITDKPDTYYFYGEAGDINWNAKISTHESGAGEALSVRSRLSFQPSNQNLTHFSGPWRIDGVLVLRDKSTKEILLQVNFSCSARCRTHRFKFDISKVVNKRVVHEIRFTELVGMGVTPRPNYLIANEMTDVCLIVGDAADTRRLHVSKAVLAHFSHYFQSMFFGDFVEKNKSEVEIKDVDARIFVALIDLCFGSLLIREPDVEQLLTLADRFLIPSATNKLQTYLLLSYDDDVMDLNYLFMADKFKLSIFMCRVLDSFNNEDVDELLKDERRFSLSPETLLHIMTYLRDELKDSDDNVRTTSTSRQETNETFSVQHDHHWM